MITKPRSSLGHTALLVLVALPIFFLGNITAVLSLPYRQGSATVDYRQETATDEPTIPAGVSLTSWSENGQGGHYVMRIIEGSVPPAIGMLLSGVVTSDTDCDINAQGLSHCHNGIALNNDRSIAVINIHDMNRNECLMPGQRVSITPLNSNWVVAAVGQPPQTDTSIDHVQP